MEGGSEGWRDREGAESCVETGEGRMEGGTEDNLYLTTVQS